MSVFFVVLDRTSRATRGRRMTKLVREEIEEGDEFWNQEALKDVINQPQETKCPLSCTPKKLLKHDRSVAGPLLPRRRLQQRPPPATPTIRLRPVATGLEALAAESAHLTALTPAFFFRNVNNWNKLIKMLMNGGLKRLQNKSQKKGGKNEGNRKTKS